ncbi:Crp/Fnr family transcriptional regulator [Bacillus massiliigorillae]|uniref:Crp/Fnr family transcriptional regulator n=1 Tax=Bacillus massiliigorillae TaxID=1243664 RepID=UPI0003A2DBF8|nr:Crp/Fnr family transcriptional regulator [Bacillus massiliigorillae]
MNEYNFLLETPLFHKVQQSELEHMLHCKGAHSVSYLKGDYISLSGESLSCMGVIVKGTVHMLKEDVKGNKVLFTIMRDKEVFGEMFISNSSFAATVSYYAATDCTILFLPLKRVMCSCSMACQFHQKFIENMTMLMSQKTIQLMNKLEIISKKTLREKILTYLTQQALVSGSSYFVLPMGRLELADYLCVNRSALTRELSNMKAEGLLDYDKNTFRLLTSI